MLVMPANIIVMPDLIGHLLQAIFYNYSRKQFADIYRTPVH